jgi:hypothetical protein
MRKSIDPLELFRRLSGALGVPASDRPSHIVRGTFPDVHADNFRDRYLLSEILRKYPGFDLGIDTRQVALQSLIDQEQTNRETNHRLSTLPREIDFAVLQAIPLAARKVRSVLGRFRWDHWLDGLRFGPGATTRLSASSAHLGGKLTGAPHVTDMAYETAELAILSSPSWCEGLEFDRAESPLVVRNYDKVTCVPKNAKTGRTIGIQPDMNVYMQLGVAYVMRKKFRKWNINLNDQSLNQTRAYEASLTGRLATVDLTNASNSLTTELVWRLVGDQSLDYERGDPTWYKVFNNLRTISGYSRELRRFFKYELFSAMGNGFTFELESLIFWSLAQACCDIQGVQPDVSVYGDDLIVPVEVIPLMERVFAYAGFTFNRSKTFSTTEGPLFRESCGKHYLDGQDVTPIYVTERLDTVDTAILLANNLVRWSLKDGNWRDGRLQEVHSWVVSHLPAWAQETCIPLGEENDGLIKSFDEATPSPCYTCTPTGTHGKTLMGYRCRTATLHSRGKKLDDRAGLAAWLYRKSFKVFSFENTLPDWHVPFADEGYKVGTRYVSLKRGQRVAPHWANLGPWA